MFYPLKERVVSHGGEEKVCAQGEELDDESWRELVATAVKETADETKDHGKGTVLSCFEPTACAVVGEELVKSVGAVGRGEDDVEGGGERLFLHGGEEAVGVLENGNADGKESWIGMGEADGGEEGV